MKLKSGFFTAATICCVLLSSSLFALDNKAEESLAKGKRLYADGRYEEAMDNFIDVFVSGNTDQIAEANEYVNLIHFDRGGVVAPKQVPYDKEISKRQNLGNEGKTMYQKTTKKETVVTKKGNSEPLRQVFFTEEQETLAEPPSSEPEADPFGAQKGSEVSSEYKSEYNEVSAKGAASEDDIIEDMPTQKVGSYEDEEYILLNGKANVKRGKNIVSNETQSSFPWGSKARVRSVQRKEEKQLKKELIDSLVAKLNADEDVQVYMRGGRVDAIDINSSALFLGKSIDKVSSPILDEVFALMVLENSPSYVILPEGSYTDDVTLHGVRQAVALNTYLINRGISPAKMVLNMGLTTQEPPEKFSNLAGISVVFDYEGKSRLKSKLQEKNLPPVLSLATYPFKEIAPSAGEVFVIDFSVMQGSSPVKDWVLQIVSHAADNHYYVVKQLSGSGPLTYQTFWNGHKGYFGHLLPLGKYTIVLRAKDTAGRERVVKRQVVLKEGISNEEDIIMKTESEVVKEEEFKRIQAEKEAKKRAAEMKAKELESKLDYSQKRLWTKPGKTQVGTITDEDGTVTETQSSSVVSTQTQESTYESSSQTSSSTSSSTSDTGNTGDVLQVQETTTTEESSSYGASSNPYAIEEEEEESNPYDI